MGEEEKKQMINKINKRKMVVCIKCVILCFVLREMKKWADKF